MKYLKELLNEFQNLPQNIILHADPLRRAFLLHSLRRISVICALLCLRLKHGVIWQKLGDISIDSCMILIKW